MSPYDMDDAFYQFDDIFNARINEANEFYDEIQQDIFNDDEKMYKDKLLQGFFGTSSFTIIMSENG
ncbi:hypothetical protein [Chryseobacterium indoltheticum]|uniref:hypothetical protein n=1 Tax=Chryseobacterium indoltheticum TaxID=254 RepID=UPI003F4961A4